MTDDWRARERAVDDTLRALTPEVAMELTVLDGNFWHAEIREPDGDAFSRPDFCIEGPAGARLRLSKGDIGEVMTRVEVYSCYPPKSELHWRRDVRTTIGVGAGRGAEVIARDIHRRLLPGYLPALADAHRRIADCEAEVARRIARRDQIRAAAGLPDATSLVSHQQSESRSTVYLNLPRGQHGTVELWSDGSSAKVELSSVPYETALAIVHLLRRINSRPAAVS